MAADQISGSSPASTSNELIINQLEEIEERTDPDRVGAKIKKYTAYYLRGFGSFDVTFGRGLYGLELQRPLRRHAENLEIRLRGMEIRIPLANRSVGGIALVSLGDEDGRIGNNGAILLNDCYPLDSGSFDKFKLADDKVEDHGRQPATMYMFIQMARQISRAFAEMYRDEHLEDRSQAIGRLSDIREAFPESPNHPLSRKHGNGEAWPASSTSVSLKGSAILSFNMMMKALPSTRSAVRLNAWSRGEPSLEVRPIAR